MIIINKKTRLKRVVNAFKFIKTCIYFKVTKKEKTICQETLTHNIKFLSKLGTAKNEVILTKNINSIYRIILKLLFSTINFFF